MVPGQVTGEYRERVFSSLTGNKRNLPHEKDDRRNDQKSNET